MIYFARFHTGAIKIGCSGNVARRMEQLEYHYGPGVELLHEMPGDYDTEDEILQKFEHLRIGRQDQFRPAPELMAFIDQPPVEGVDIDLIEPVARKASKASKENLSFSVEIVTKDRIDAFNESLYMKVPLSSVCRYLITKGLDAVEQEAAVKAEKEVAK